MLPRKGERWSKLMLRREFAWSVVYVALFGLLAGMVSIYGREGFHYREGQLVFSPIVSRVAFTAVDHEKTAINRRDASEREPAVYTPNTSYLTDIKDRLLELGKFGADQTIEGFDKIPPATRKKLALDPVSYEALRQFIAAEGLPRWNSLVDSFMLQFSGLAVLSHERVEEEKDNRPLGIVLKRGTSETEASEWQLYAASDAAGPLRDQLASRVYDKASTFPAEPLRALVTNLIMSNLQPIYRMDEELSRQRREAASEAVLEALFDRKPGEMLVSAGTQLKQSTLQLLREERRAYANQLPAPALLLHRGGTLAMLLLLGFGMWVYLARFNPRIVANPTRGLGLLGLLLLGQAAAVLATRVIPEYQVVTITFPTLCVAIVLAIVYDQRFALAIGAIQVVLVLLSSDVSPAFALVLISGIGVAVSQLSEIRNRSKLVWTGFWTGLAMAATLWMTAPLIRPWLMESQLPNATFVQLNYIAKESLLLMLTGFLSGIFVQGMLPAIERVFNVTTSMTLKELNDASHPLLQRLAQDAPGTYQHSLRLADVSESGATAIGANGLLCRVGAMYHDIGKMNKPAYFVENQGGGPNRHDKLSPAMSVLIIVGHVKDGIEMGREYGLPKPLRHFIESHHGTTLVEYFYHEARRRSEEDDAPTPTEFEFRYPGPKPQTKEAAILMLCDGIESAARTLPEPTPVRLEQLVRNMANKRLMDGQFDECNLTLKELHAACDAIHKTLCAVYHNRIAYPKDDAKPQPPAASAPPAAPAAQTA